MHLLPAARCPTPLHACRLKKYAALVSFVSAEDVRRSYFTPESCPEDFQAEGFLAKKK